MPRNKQEWHQIRDGDPPKFLFDHIPTNLQLLLLCMINPDHEKRPTCLEALKHLNNSINKLNRISYLTKSMFYAFFVKILLKIQILFNIMLAPFQSFFQNPNQTPQRSNFSFFGTAGNVKFLYNLLLQARMIKN